MTYEYANFDQNFADIVTMPLDKVSFGKFWEIIWNRSSPSLFFLESVFSYVANMDFFQFFDTAVILNSDTFENNVCSTC